MAERFHGKKEVVSPILTSGLCHFNHLTFYYAATKFSPPAMHHVQTLQLLDTQKYPHSWAETCDEETLQMVQEAHRTQRSKENLMMHTKNNETKMEAICPSFIICYS